MPFIKGGGSKDIIKQVVLDSLPLKLGVVRAMIMSKTLALLR